MVTGVRLGRVRGLMLRLVRGDMLSQVRRVNSSMFISRDGNL